MDRRSMFLVGTALVLLGLLSLIFMAIASFLDFRPAAFLWRLWPLTVTGAGLGLVLPPLLVRGRRSLGALFIPGMPVLTTAGLLLLASVLNAWAIWGWLWPMLLISLAMGFLFAAIYMRLIWLVVPATILGLNGMVFQFCALSGLWHWWSVLWVIEPLSVGLSLLLVGLRKGIPGLTTAGLILSGVTGALFLLMLIVLGVWWPIALLSSGLLILGGLGLLGWGLLRTRFTPSSALE